MKTLMRGEVSQIIKANREDVFKTASYENIPQWSKTFKSLKIVSKNGNTVRAEVETRILGIKFKATVTGVFKPYEEVVEEIVISDGTITKERVRFTEVPEGTRVDWTGEVVQFGRWIKIFGPLMKWAFQKSVKKMFEDLGKYMESGKWKKG
jgi:carbon monoxide dehydrogenase subunit G